jgi:ATP-binding cassette subfamily B protein
MAAFKGAVFAVVSSFVVSNTLLAIVPIFVGRLVAALASRPIDVGAVHLYVGALIACSVGHDLTWRLSELLYQRFILRRGYEYENVLFGRVVNYPYPYFVGKFTGKISNYVEVLGREFRRFLEAIFYEYLDLLIKLPSIVVIMFVVNTWTGSCFLASIIVMLIIGRITIRRAAVAERRWADLSSEMNGYVIDVIANFVSVKSFGREPAEYRRVRGRRDAVIGAAESSFFWNVVFWGSLSVIVRYLLWPGTILLNVHMVLHHRISLAQFSTFMSTLVIFSEFIWGTIFRVSELNLQIARVEEAYRYLFGAEDVMRGLPGPATADEWAEPPVPYRSVLEFRRLCFAYPENRSQPVLADITLEVARNEKIGVVGRSGSGKTTFIKLLLGYYELPAGMLLLDGRPIRTRQLARSISYVPQDTSLFHRSIRDNIAYGAGGAVSQTDLERAARRANAHDFIADTIDGYDTLVGERGIKLSMGQRQRIAIARAFLDDKPLLILDEATSALDSESERLVQDALENLWRDKTVIAVAHRLSTLLHMDRIVVVDGGRVVEQGSHHELIAAGGHYHRLWRLQGGLIGAEAD